MARKATKRKTGTSTHLRPMVRATAASTQGATRRKPARRASVAKAAARRARKRRPYYASGPSSAIGPLYGPFERASTVTYGRRARGRAKARVYGPSPSPSAYRAKRRKGKARRRGRTAAQRAATRRLVALNRARRGRGKAKSRRRTGGRRKGGRTAAQRRAFRKMMAGLRRYKAGKGHKRRGRGRARRSSKRMPSRKALRRFIRKLPKKAELRVFSDRRRGSKVRGYTLRNPRRNPRGGQEMARHRNPRRRRRRNPGRMGGIVGMAKKTLKAAIPAVAGGALMSLIDAKLLATLPGGQAVRFAGKVVAAGAAAVVLRKWPATAQIMMGAMLGSAGYELGAKLAGGLVAPDKRATTEALVMLSRQDPQGMAALVSASGALYTVPSLAGGLQLPDMSMQDVNLG